MADIKLQLVELGKRLRREATLAAESLRQDVVKPGEITHLPTHPADQDVEGLDVEIAIAQNEELLFEQVEAAIGRIEAGTYGVCQECGKPIDEARLKAIPYAAHCIGCARSDHDEIDQPVRGEPRRFR
ncbi:TraR/DksA C4-type zinc finger protein [Anatilimnocola floriformis]|uniref:TraR/DksA C4-type zinc finger protein n=1 Tax=Anatilimnocola floriformis TaxID=2948575 RepID=UPI0020C202BD|nr:TraR/DksA C4-type zinc finger protein [Anatilimnocola floriformis]